MVTGTILLRGQSTVALAGTHYGYDADRDLVVVRLATDELSYPVATLQGDTENFTFVDVQREVLRYDTTYGALDRAGDSVTVAFTRLPLIKIVTERNLNQYEHRPATFSYVDDEQELQASIGIRHRGSYSLRFPKKSFDMEFWENTESQKSTDVTFGDLREDDDWVLDALYNEPMRVNSYVAHKLWLDMHSPYYQQDEPEAKSGADVMYAEVFYDGGYHGLYMMSEQVDRKQLKLKKFKDGKIRGELYKGVGYSDATLFRGQPSLQINSKNEYAAWEVKHPDTEDIIDYSNLYDLLGFVTKDTDENFRGEAGKYFELGNIRDYFLFINVATLTDNAGKNTYLARYDTEEPYFYAPWDLDASFGNRYNGERELRTELWITNGLQDRLLELSPEYYNSQLCSRYDELRLGLFDPDNLMARLETQIKYLKDNGVYEREVMRWPESVDISDDQIAFTNKHITARIAYLDDAACEFSTALPDLVAPASPPIIVYPNPASQRVNVKHAFTQSTAYDLLNVTGQIVASGYINGEQDHIDVSHLRTGLYFLRLGRQSARVVVAR